MSGTFAQFEVKSASLSQDFGIRLAGMKFNLSPEQLKERFGVYSRGPRKGLVRGEIFWIKIVKGGWIKKGRNSTDGEGNITSYNGFVASEGSCGFLLVGPGELCPYMLDRGEGERNQFGAIINSPLNPGYHRHQKMQKEVAEKQEAERIAKEKAEAELNQKIAHYSKEVHEYVKFFNDKVTELETQGASVKDWWGFVESQTEMFKKVDPENKILTTVAPKEPEQFFRIGFK